MDNISADKAVKKTKIIAWIEIITGIFLTAFNGLFVIVGTTQAKDSTDVTLIAIFGCLTAAGIFLLRAAHQRKDLIKKFNDYSARLKSNPSMTLPNLASEVNEPITDLAKDISKMIVYGFFPNSYIDAKTGRLITPDSNMQTFSFTNQNIHTVSDKTEFVTVQCQNCGATNKIIKGSVGECEFCGSQISQ